MTGGSTWTKRLKGMPKVAVGKIGVAIAPSNPKRIYALIETIRCVVVAGGGRSADAPLASSPSSCRRHHRVRHKRALRSSRSARRMRFGFDGAMATPIFPTGDFSIPFTAFVHVLPRHGSVDAAARAGRSRSSRCASPATTSRQRSYSDLRGRATARAPGVFVDEEHASPRRYRVSGAIDAALLLRSRGASSRAGKDDVRVVGWMRIPPECVPFP